MTGNRNNAKSPRVYLEMMMNLEKEYPWLYKRFNDDCLFFVRWSEQYWAGVWSELSTEQIMMRSLKSRGGLTRGNRFTESVGTLWIYSMHASATYHNALSTLTRTVHKTSNQHKELVVVVKQEILQTFQN